MHVHVLLWLDFMFQGSKFRSRTHTHTHPHCTRSLYNVCDSPNRQSPRHLNMPPFLSRCEWFLNTRQSSVPNTQIHPKHDACYPVVHSCQHKCLLEVDVEMTQDVTVNKGMCRSSVLHQLTFIVRHLNPVFVLTVRSFLRDGPLNAQCACRGLER